ncbi:MAG: peptidase, partial [Nitrosopumilus sp.]|nr:peptidase [Nitrosopumilus sp.]
MKTTIMAIAAMIIITSNVSSAYAEVPSWVKNNAGWWADGTISESEFISGIEFLINDGIITIASAPISSQTSDGVPDWVKNNAGWWADGTISDDEFVNGIQHLISLGIINVSESVSTKTPTPSDDSELRLLQAELNRCAEITKAYDRLNCERSAKHLIASYEYK